MQNANIGYLAVSLGYIAPYSVSQVPVHPLRFQKKNKRPWDSPQVWFVSPLGWTTISRRTFQKMGCMKDVVLQDWLMSLRNQYAFPSHHMDRAIRLFKYPRCPSTSSEKVDRNTNWKTGTKVATQSKSVHDGDERLIGYGTTLWSDKSRDPKAEHSPRLCQTLNKQHQDYCIQMLGRSHIWDIVSQDVVEDAYRPTSQLVQRRMFGV